MKRAALGLFAAISLVVASALTAHAGGGPENVLVVVNGKDPSSAQIGAYYMKARDVPQLNLVTLELPVTLETDLATYKKKIENPIQDAIARRKLEDQIDYIVLTRGIPIRVRMPGGTAATTACLMVMDTPISGRRQRRVPLGKLSNPYRDFDKAFHHDTAYHGMHLYLATFLTGYDASDATALVDRAMEAEKSPPKNPSFLFQDAKGNAAGRNRYYDRGIDRLKKMGFAADHLPAGRDSVKDEKNVMGYMSGGSYSGITEKDIASDQFLPGAIADMLESFGAVPRNFDPGKKSQVPVTWFIRHGISGIHGAVAEPYAHTFPDTLLFARYASGMNLAESFWASIPFLYWQNMVIGDPLLAPFAKRPQVKISGLPAGEGKGTIQVAVSADSKSSVKDVELFADGHLVGRIAGGSGTISVDTTKLENGPHELLAAAVLDGATEVQGWSEKKVDVNNPGLSVIGLEPGVSGSIHVALNREIKAGETLSASVDGDPATVRPVSGAKAAVLVPKSQLPAGRSVPVVFSGAASRKMTYLTPPAGFVVKVVPSELTAGVKGHFEATAVDRAGNPVKDFRGHLAVSVNDPPITGFDDGVHTATIQSPITLDRAGKVVLTVRDRITGEQGETDVMVKSGPPAALEVRPSPFPQGRAEPLTATLLDAFGNPVSGLSGGFTLSIPDDPKASVPSSPAKISDGRLRFPDTVLWRRGLRQISVKDASGDVVAEGRVKVVAFAERSWLMLGPLKGTLGSLPIAPDKLSPSEGRLAGGGVWRPVRSGGDEIRLRRELGDGHGVDYASLYVFAPKDIHCHIQLGYGAKLAFFVDDRRIFAAKRERRKLSSDAEDLPMFPLKKGWHRLLLVADNGGRSDAFELRITDGEGDAVQGLRTSLSDPNTPGAISGRVMSGSSGLPGAKVELSGPTDVTTRTDDDGKFAVGGLPPGTYTVTPDSGGLAVTPASRRVEVKSAPVSGVTFDARDDNAPRVEVIAPKDGARIGSHLVVDVNARDNVGVAKVWLTADGKKVGDVKTKYPFHWEIDTSAFRPGLLRLRAVAEDGSGNEGKSPEVRVRIYRDRYPPRIRILFPRNGQMLAGRERLRAEVVDDVEVAKVEFLVDGKAIGKPFTSGPYQRMWNARKEKRGTHTFTVRATDEDGNTTESTVKFRTP